MDFPVFLGEEAVGSVRVDTRGLYYEVCCSCSIVCGIYRLKAETSSGDLTIGILSPKNGRLSIQRSVAQKKIGTFHRFYLAMEGETEFKFIPVYADQPFPGIDKIEKAVFAVRNGIPGIELPD